MIDSINNLSLLLIAGYFLFLVMSLTWRGKVVSGPWWFLLRSFFPNWRFYHGAGHQPRLFWRIADVQGSVADWKYFARVLLDIGCHTEPLDQLDDHLGRQFSESREEKSFGVSKSSSDFTE